MSSVGSKSVFGHFNIKVVKKMSRGGHNKKANKLQVLEGRDRSDRAKNTADIKGGFPVDPPVWLPEYARQFWQQNAAILDQAGILTAADESAFQVMALTFNTICLCEKSIDEEGINVEGAKGVRVKNPAISTLNAARQQFRLQKQEFGLDPGSRERLGVQITDPADVSKMEQLINKRREESEMNRLLDR